MFDKEYFKLAKKILKEGKKKIDRTGIGTISYFGTQSRYNLNNGFPLLTTKKVNFDAILHELIWFISGDTNIKYLVQNKVNIWNEWPYEKFKKSNKYRNESMDEFKEKIISNNKFAKKWGELGPIYGKQWRNFGKIDQLKKLIEDIKKNSGSRRLIVSAWNVPEIKSMLLPPCHSFFQFYVNDGKLSCQLYQRSGDIFLGVPFNIASYSILTNLIAHVTNLKIGEFIHTIGDSHIYLNHLDQINAQLKRKPYPYPTLEINKDITNLFDFKFEDVKLKNYKHHSVIKGKIAI